MYQNGLTLKLSFKWSGDVCERIEAQECALEQGIVNGREAVGG